MVINGTSTWIPLHWGHQGSTVLASCQRWWDSMAHISKMDWIWIITPLWIGFFAASSWEELFCLSLIGEKWRCIFSIAWSIQSTQNMANILVCRIGMIELNDVGSIIYDRKLHPRPWPCACTQAPGVYWFLRGKCKRLPGNCYFVSRSKILWNRFPYCWWKNSCTTRDV